MENGFVRYLLYRVNSNPFYSLCDLLDDLRGIYRENAELYLGQISETRKEWDSWEIRTIIINLPKEDF